MSRSSKLYAYLVSAIGIALGIYCTYEYINSVIYGLNIQTDFAKFAVIWLLYIVCRCFPIDIRDDYAIDMSFICDVAMILYLGPFAAGAMIFLSAPFIVSQSKDDKATYCHIFNTEPIKTAFNTANAVTSAYLSGLIFIAFGGKVGNLELPNLLLPLIVLVVVYFLLNCSILLILFTLSGQISFFASLYKNLFDFFPNIVATTPIGFFIAKFLTMPNGEYLVLLFMLPLMLARYSFVLYLDTKKNYYNMVKTLTAALEAKDQYTEGHSHRVEIYARQIAKKMHLPAYDIEDVQVAALLHDVGKIGIDDQILNKPGRLTTEERTIIMEHPQIGVNILKNVKLSKTVKTIILHHHERYDGKGYPDHTTGDEIPIEVYVVALADAYDAMTSNRPYCDSRTTEQVVQIVQEESGKQFHPKVVEAFLQVLQDEEKI